MDNELWLPVLGYEKYYAVSNYGRVRSLYSNIILKQGSRPIGYRIVSLSKGGRATTKSVHRLVAEAFSANSGKKPCVNHLDGNKANNNATNLEWCTHKENMMHAHANGLVKHKSENARTAKLSWSDVGRIRKMLANKETHIRIAERFSITASNVGSIARNETWRLSDEV